MWHTIFLSLDIIKKTKGNDVFIFVALLYEDTTLKYIRQKSTLYHLILGGARNCRLGGTCNVCVQCQCTTEAIHW